jgi:hypothetical protein
MDPLADRRDDASPPRDPLGVHSSPAHGQASVINHVAVNETPSAISSTASETPLIVSRIAKDIETRTHISESSCWTEYQLEVGDWDTLKSYLEECDKSEKLRYVESSFNLTTTDPEI